MDSICSFFQKLLKCECCQGCVLKIKCDYCCCSTNIDIENNNSQPNKQMRCELSDCCKFERKVESNPHENSHI